MCTQRKLIIYLECKIPQLFTKTQSEADKWKLSNVYLSKMSVPE